jgi:hypothetical protein
MSLLRLSGIASFMVLSLLVYFLTGAESIASDVQFSVFLSYVVLVTGIATRRPDIEVLAWLLLGSGLLLVAAGFGDNSYLVAMTLALGVVCLADFEHSVVMMRPGIGDVIDDNQESIRWQLLIKRAKTIGILAGGSLALSVLGLSLAPPLVLSGESAAIVGVLAVAVIVSVVLVAYLER